MLPRVTDVTVALELGSALLSCRSAWNVVLGLEFLYLLVQ